MQVRVTINPILFPELINYLESKPSGQRSSSLLALANRALLAGDAFAPGVVRETSKKRKSEQKKSSFGPKNNSTGQMTSHTTEPPVDDTQDKEAKFRQENSGDTVDRSKEQQAGNDVQQQGTEEVQQPAVSLASLPEHSGNEPEPTTSELNGAGTTDNNHGNEVNGNIRHRRVRIN